MPPGFSIHSQSVMNIVTVIEIIDPVSTPHNSVFLNEKFN